MLVPPTKTMTAATPITGVPGMAKTRSVRIGAGIVYLRIKTLKNGKICYPRVVFYRAATPMLSATRTVDTKLRTVANIVLAVSSPVVGNVAFVVDPRD